jgi:hypothetical protein
MMYLVSEIVLGTGPGDGSNGSRGERCCSLMNVKISVCKNLKVTRTGITGQDGKVLLSRCSCPAHVSGVSGGFLSVRRKDRAGSVAPACPPPNPASTAPFLSLAPPRPVCGGLPPALNPASRLPARPPRIFWQHHLRRKQLEALPLSSLRCSPNPATKQHAHLLSRQHRLRKTITIRASNTAEPPRRPESLPNSPAHSLVLPSTSRDLRPSWHRQTASRSTPPRRRPTNLRETPRSPTPPTDRRSRFSRSTATPGEQGRHSARPLAIEGLYKKNPTSNGDTMAPALSAAQKVATAQFVQLTGASERSAARVRFVCPQRLSATPRPIYASISALLVPSSRCLQDPDAGHCQRLPPPVKVGASSFASSPRRACLCTRASAAARCSAVAVAAMSRRALSICCTSWADAVSCGAVRCGAGQADGWRNLTLCIVTSRPPR